MQPDAPALLWQARRAAGLVIEFLNGRTFEDYKHDPMLRSAVERQFQVVGEALNRLSRVDPATAGEVPDLPRIVAFRNVLVHGYATIDDALVPIDVSRDRDRALADELRDDLERGATFKHQRRVRVPEGVQPDDLAPASSGARERAEPIWDRATDPSRS